jgi:hypothetical protein
MIHKISKTYGITKQEAAFYTEYDFWEMIGFENMEIMRNEYLRAQAK